MGTGPGEGSLGPLTETGTTRPPSRSVNALMKVSRPVAGHIDPEQAA